MHKAKRLLQPLAVAIGIISASLVVASSAPAATVTHQVLSPGPPEPFFGGNCGFPLTASFTGGVQLTIVEKNDGTVQLIFTPSTPSTITVTNPASGRSLTSLQVGGEVIVITDSSFRDHSGGIIWNFVVPGAGGVLQWIGMNNFATGAFDGRFTSDTSAFCAYLAGT